MVVTDSAYVAVLENKLMQAERSLYEFKRIFRHWTTRDLVGDRVPPQQQEEPVALKKNESTGIYPGQIRPLGRNEEGGDVHDLAEQEEACVE